MYLIIRLCRSPTKLSHLQHKLLNCHQTTSPICLVSYETKLVLSTCWGKSHFRVFSTTTPHHSQALAHMWDQDDRCFYCTHLWQPGHYTIPYHHYNSPLLACFLTKGQLNLPLKMQQRLKFLSCSFEFVCSYLGIFLGWKNSAFIGPRTD